MPISGETRAALDLLKDVQAKVRQTENLSNNHQVNADLNTLISVLESPVFQSILNIQDSLRELKRQVQLHPSILPSDFDITPSGELVLNLPQQQQQLSPAGANANVKANVNVSVKNASLLSNERGTIEQPHHSQQHQASCDVTV